MCCVACLGTQTHAHTHEASEFPGYEQFPAPHQTLQYRRRHQEFPGGGGRGKERRATFRPKLCSANTKVVLAHFQPTVMNILTTLPPQIHQRKRHDVSNPPFLRTGFDLSTLIITSRPHHFSLSLFKTYTFLEIPRDRCIVQELKGEPTMSGTFLFAIINGVASRRVGGRACTR